MCIRDRLEVKEESIKTRNELEKEIKERRAEVQRTERRVLSKEESLDKMCIRDSHVPRQCQAEFRIFNVS